MWLLFAILSSIFAALTSILAKVGREDGKKQTYKTYRRFKGCQIYQ